jgi:hypothetical protein
VEYLLNNTTMVVHRTRVAGARVYIGQAKCGNKVFNPEFVDEIPTDYKRCKKCFFVFTDRRRHVYDKELL